MTITTPTYTNNLTVSPLRRGILAWFAQWNVTLEAVGRATLLRHGVASWDDVSADLADSDPAASIALSAALETAYAPEQFHETVEPDAIAQAGLLASPTPFYLDAVEEAIRLAVDALETASSGSGLRTIAQTQINAVLLRHGLHWAVNDAGALFWTGDSGAAKLLTHPALDVLGDTRMRGARAEFEAAIAHLRADSDKAREDAIEEAAKSVESAMKVVLDAIPVSRSETDSAEQLWNRFNAEGLVGPYTKDAIRAPSKIRNKLGGHGSGSAPRTIATADAQLAVHSATAILFLNTLL